MTPTPPTPTVRRLAADSLERSRRRRELEARPRWTLASALACAIYLVGASTVIAGWLGAL